MAARSDPHRSRHGPGTRALSGYEGLVRHEGCPVTWAFRLRGSATGSRPHPVMSGDRLRDADSGSTGRCKRATAARLRHTRDGSYRPVPTARPVETIPEP